ncbi:MAG TPA: MG2 domain-containing protein, partial [Flavihumibacter sp.]
LEPSIRFVNGTAGYLSAEGARNIEIKIVNVPRVKLVVSKIYESNLLAANQYGYYPRESGRLNDYEDYYYNSGDFTLGDIIYEKEIDTRSLPRLGSSQLLEFNLEDRLPELKGAYHIKVRSTKDYWISDSRMFSLSDIGLIVKEGSDKLMVFANSIKTTNPLSGVNVVAYGANNQVLGMGSTNSEGVAEISYSRKEAAGFKPAMMIAKSAGDFNYLLFNNSRVNTSRFEVGGKRLNATGLDAYVYLERGIYRPGETVNFAAIVRDYSWKVVPDLPVKWKVLFPTGKEMKTFRKTLNRQGSTDGSIEIPAAALTGTYLLEMYSGNDVLLNSLPIQVEEFVPDRIKVQSKLSATELKPGETVELALKADNFFGPPAAHRNYEAEIQVRQLAFAPKKYASYLFTLTNQQSFFDKKLIEGKTNESGEATIRYTVPPIYDKMGLLQARFFTTVFDETGRPVSRMSSAEISTQSAYLGIGYNGYDYFPLNQEVKFPLIALSRNEQVLNNQSAKVEVIKQEYRTVLSRSGDYFRYESQREEKIVASANITISGENTNYGFVPRSPGNYEIRLRLPGSTTYVSRSFYSYGSWGGDYSSFEVNNDGHIEIETDKAVYQPGDQVKLLFKTPFSGRLLVTLEQDKLLSYQYLEVEKRTATLTLPITEAHLPNVYVTATLIKAHEISDIPLTVAHGFKGITVEDKRRNISVEILAEAGSRSRKTQQIKVKAAPGAMVTLAAVDNGVLQVNDFKTPDPFRHFYADRALSVNAFDLYPLLFPELKAVRSSTGGDGDLRMDQRVNPMPNKRVKILSYWSGLTTTNSSGEASFNVEIPAFSGEIRLMAVAHKDDRFGSAEKTMKVADPVVLSTALPRFMSPGDSIDIPVTISNTTARPINGKAGLKLTGPVQSLGAAEQSVTLQPNAEQRLVFHAAAGPSIGQATVKLEINAGGENYYEDIDITVRPASTLQKRTGSGVVEANGTTNLTLGDPDFLASSVRRKLVVSRSPVLELGDALDKLVNYPYGCTEQSISAAFPQLYFTDLSELLQKGDGSRKAAAANVLEAIRKIKMRQLYSGALTLWDNDRTEQWWTTIYAAHFLIEAGKAGFDVDPSLLETMLNYINHRLGVKNTVTYYYNGNQQKKIAPREVAYSLYVLALAGKANIATMNYYKARPEVLSLDSKYMLAASYALAGDKNRFNEILPGAFAGEESVAVTGGSFYSPLRDEAIALNVLLEADPKNQQVPQMARNLAQRFKKYRWFSTQEAAFGLLALGKMASAQAGSNAVATISSDGKTVGKMDGKSISLSTANLASANVQIKASGGSVYYWWEAEGISASGSYKEEDQYLKIRRAYFDRNGRAFNGRTFKQNDLIVVQLTLEKAYSGTIENVVITDLLPAGFEIENPRTREIPGMDWIKDAANPTALDLRDDRIHLFVDADRAKQVYYYAVRAVSPGVYQQGPVSADAMYNSDYHSYHGAGKITILSR